MDVSHKRIVCSARRKCSVRTFTAFLIVVLAACNTLPIVDDGSISSFDALALLEKCAAVLIDVRGPEEKKNSILRGSIEIQFGPSDFLVRPATAEEKADFVGKVAAVKTGGKKLLLYCQYGVRSAAARQALAEMGIDSLSVAGGWSGKGDNAGLKDWL